MNITIPVRTIRRAAADAEADPRSVAKVARGEHVRGIVAERIEEALRRLGVAVPSPASAPPADAQQQGEGHR